LGWRVVHDGRVAVEVRHGVDHYINNARMAA
jgi:hypothetical protein